MHRQATESNNHIAILSSRLCHSLGKLVISLSTKRPWFDPRLTHVESVVDNVTLGRVFLRVLKVFPSVSFHQCSSDIFHLFTTAAIKS